MHATKNQTQNLISLQKRADFLNIQKDGSKWVSKGLIVQAKKHENENVQRVGFTVTKRVDKRAVVRNRIKRRLRAVAADVLPVYGKVGCDYVLVGRAETLEADYQALCRDLKWCLKRLNCLQEKGSD